MKTWHDKIYKLSPFDDITILNKNNISLHLNKFYSEVVNNIKDD
jgi:hypothetical protein